MFDLTEDFDNFSEKYYLSEDEALDIFDRKRVSECRKRMEDLSKGISSLDKPMCDEMDRLNRLTRDRDESYNMCPAYYSEMMDFNSFFDVKYCLYSDHGGCVFMDILNKHVEEVVGTGTKLIFDFHTEHLIPTAQRVSTKWSRRCESI